MIEKKRTCILENYNLVKYRAARSYQRSLVTERINNSDLDDVLILLEHPPVYTLGTGSTLDYLKFDPQNSEFEIHRIERGGEVTYHCPHQLVGYPIINLRYYQQDLHWYLRQLEEVIIQTLANYNLTAYRIPNLTGVWLEEKKVAAIGIKVKRWITMHGFALNVCPDLDGFKQIIPCGIADKPVGSLAEFIPDITVEGVRQDVAQAFEQVFQVNLVEKRGRSIADTASREE
ncbi:lipoyl(octanoyl) transferase LipB [Waterburya agarophytonicola K14]|uniref:Octanoyltransferase n=1 Tax=Waterburya agarophytonicola KI4 TaxID=2874699 RepID=A0A964BPC4_9CYAN|nr:lipoyl(octanoyl) transferase LipB [Waterburya agarophytonicola]MCC0176033.1 lipoyl(octanoyl) transferase LipB [Waterburya agarophytonicola KI4]